VEVGGWRQVALASSCTFGAQASAGREPEFDHLRSNTSMQSANNSSMQADVRPFATPVCSHK
jgi:hypothetical protein